MANPFTRTANSSQTPNRNTFDGSFVNNLTLKAGVITPCFLKEVIPGDHFKIGATFGFNFMPMVFPVQTNMQANLHFFYVRNRALWDGWQEFITKTNDYDPATGNVTPNADLVPPYIKLTGDNRNMFETGQIGDYLGVPTVYYSSGLFDRKLNYWMSNLRTIDDKEAYSVSYPYVFAGGYLSPIRFSYNSPLNSFNEYLGTQIAAMFTDGEPNQMKRGVNNLNGYIPFFFTPLPSGIQSVSMYDADLTESFRTINFDGQLIDSSDSADGMKSNFYICQAIVSRTLGADGKHEVLGYLVYGLDSDDNVKVLYQNIVKVADGEYIFAFNGKESSDYAVVTWNSKIINSGINWLEWNDTSAMQLKASIDGFTGIPNSYQSLLDLPFASNVKEDGIRISALPFRAVEAVYNSFYRDDRNNPLMVDGSPVYNTWNLTTKGGADTSLYKLYRKNWESDVFTSAVQSPQQGVAPLVGVTATGEMTFQDEGGKTYYLQAEIGDDGNTVTGIKSYSSDMPVGTLRAMVDTISTGISINDFRNVNALQRWLETNMRKGLRYKDQIQAHFGTSPTYSELDMPEFIGGMSRSVSMNKVVQTSEGSNPLGTLAGNASVLGDGGQPIDKYCDEHGWIIGFISITPSPVYSQQLNKQLLKSNLLDYYFPEFAHIGYQPILNQEIAPLQCTDDDGSKLSDVFGYQRAWYEYLSSLDEVHGEFRSTMRNYIINRVFQGVPQLSEDFLTVSSDEVNEVFADRTDTDKIYGQIYFDVKMKRPIPAVGVPRLEVG